jgi:exodeoxyribonuclease V beta subunit
MGGSTDIFSFQFSSGIHLVEANAGTGKTFSIEVIFLKALLELGLQVHQILLVTFTKNVTAEMKKRVFDAIQVSYDYFQKEKKDTPFSALLEHYLTNKEQAKARLYRALVHFDENAIFSIHGFASQMNREFFIDSNLGRASSLEQALKKKAMQEAIHGFWIENILPSTSEAKYFFQLFSKEKRKYEIFFTQLIGKEEFVNFCFSKEDLPFPNLENSYKILEKEFSCDGLLELQEKTKIKPRFRGSIEEKSKEVIQAIIDRKLLLPIKAAAIDFPKWAENLIKKNARDELQKNAALQSLLQHLNKEKQFLEYYRKKFLLFAKEKLEFYKKNQQLYDYDDIIYAFHKLTKKKSLDRFPLVIIDEFQDTDWTQNSAFLQLFPKKITMVLVGDPKQAIFSFRGGDIFSYLKMKNDFVKTKPSQLDINWRSQKEIVENVNLLFQQENSLLLPQLNYFPSRSILEENTGVFFNHQKQDVWNVWECDEYNKPEEAVLRHLTAQIATMIDEGKKKNLLVDGKPLEPEMICILVATNENIKQVKKYLARAGVFCAAKIRFPIIQTAEFQSWWNLLQCILLKKDKRMIFYSITSPLLGYSWQQAKNLSEDAWAEISQKFRTFYQVWQKKGMIAMMNLVIIEMKILENLILLGNRELANFLQSVNWFLKYSKQKPSAEQVVSFFQKQIDLEAEEEELNLESYNNAVQIMTVHKSKGLEFPIVFCPYLWKPRNVRSDFGFFHGKTKDDKILSYDLSFDELYKEQVKDELNAEQRRLLYVILTRAKHQIHIYAHSKKQKTAFEFLFHSLKDQSSNEELEKICKQRELSALAEVILTSDKESTTSPQKRKRTFFPKRKNYSFSSLKNMSSHKFFEQAPSKAKVFLEKPDPQKSLEENFRSVFSGAAFGNLFHKILEFWVAEQKTPSQLEAYILQNISNYFLDNSWAPILSGICQKITSHPLSAQNKTFSLAELSKKNVVKEMGFQLRLSKEELIFKLEQMAKKHPQNSMIKQVYCTLATHKTERELQDICTGFIDLVFLFEGKYYILDWKSNYLGELENYLPLNIQKTVQDYDYFLQYLLYYLALQKFLRVKNITADIGGVFYLFLRGLNNENTSSGVFFDAMDYMKKILGSEQ